MRPPTRRQREVAVCMLLGMTLKETGRRLGISPRSVESHRMRLFKKFMVSTGQQLVSKIYNAEQTV